MTIRRRFGEWRLMPSARAVWFHASRGRWGLDEMQRWLRHYATDDERGAHTKEFSKDQIHQSNPRGQPRLARAQRIFLTQNPRRELSNHGWTPMNTDGSEHRAESGHFSSPKATR